MVKEYIKNVLIVFGLVFAFCLVTIGIFLYFPMWFGDKLGTALAFSFFFSLLIGLLVGFAKTYT